MEKIAYVYPTRIMPGMIANVIHHPEVIFLANKFPESMSLYVYAGVMLESDAAYSINVDILKDGKSLIPEDRKATKLEYYNVVVTPSRNYVSTVETWVPSVEFPSEGLYEIKVSLFRGSVQDKSKDAVDQGSCFVLLCKEWEES